MEVKGGPSPLERRLIEQADDPGGYPVAARTALLREAAGALGECRRAMVEASGLDGLRMDLVSPSCDCSDCERARRFAAALAKLEGGPKP